MVLALLSVGREFCSLVSEDASLAEAGASDWPFAAWVGVVSTLRGGRSFISADASEKVLDARLLVGLPERLPDALALDLESI